MPSTNLALALLLLPAFAASPARAQEASAPATAQSQDAALKALFAESDEANLKRNPLLALQRGDLRYAEHLGNFLSDAYFDAERAANRSDLARLKAIDRAALNPTDRIAYDVFQWQAENNLKGLTPEILALTAVRPLDHFHSLHIYYPAIASGAGDAPFKTLADYENNLKRNVEYVALLDEAIVRFRQGMKTGIVQPKLIVNNMIEQFDTQIAQGVDASPFYGPVRKFPEGISAADQARLETEYAAMIRDRIQPANVRMRDFLKNDYLPVARDSIGLVHMKGGTRLYDLLIEQRTTLPYTADQVHALGLSEVKRIKTEMEAIRTQVGFKGNLAEFFVFMRTDPRFKPKTRQELVDGYYAIGKRVDAAIAGQFSTIPKTPLEIRPYEQWRERTQAMGSYESGVYDPSDPKKTRPGIFYFNTYDLPSRTTPGMEALFLHEGAPGHHFQISLTQENEELPAFMRYGFNTAYVEGWGLYAESLWEEFGMETDPYQRFGGLDGEMLRAMRLVVDSGIHAKGWTRDQAIAYMLDNSGMSRTNATAEVERYVAMPGQALAYKIGALTIQRLKARAQRELGAKFDPREFHAQVLMTGSLPMRVLERKIDDWIASRKK